MFCQVVILFLLLVNTILAAVQSALHSCSQEHFFCSQERFFAPGSRFLPRSKKTGSDNMPLVTAEPYFSNLLLSVSVNQSQVTIEL
jgi:hypothetical protein